MASGYLGKISAVVSANTAGYVRSLNEAAKETKSFAKTVQSDISRASNEAKRAFDSMYTPLQRVQRALQAASSQKLSFKGFDGGIKTIEQLKRSVASIQKNTDIAIKVTGKDSITQLRQEFDSLGSDMQQKLVSEFNVDNIQQVKRILDSIRGDKAIQATFEVIGVQTIDQLKERIDRLDEREIQVVLNAVNQGAFERAKTELEQLKSVADQLAKPLGDVAKQFSKLGVDVQASFIPALSQVQNEVAGMERAIRSGTFASEKDFSRLEAKVQKVTASMSRLSQAADITAGMRTGNELEFTDPNFQQRLLDARAAGDAAANIPASRRQSDGQIKEIVANLGKATQESLRLQANLEKTRATGLLNDIISAENELEDSLKVVDQLTQKLRAKNSVEAEAAALAQKQAEAQKQRLANASSLLQVVDPNKDAAIGASQNIEAYLIQLQKIEEREQKIALNRAKMANASDFLQVVTANPDAIAGASTPLDPAFLQRNTEDKASRELGANISKASRDMDKLRSKTVSLRDTIETLPNSVASGLIPQLRRAEQEFVRLRASASASEEEIENAANEVDQLAASVRRIGSTQGISTFAEAFDDAEIRGALGSLAALQQMLLRVGAAADSEAVAAFEEMRIAVQRATIEGRIGTEAFNEEMEELIRNAANATSQISNIKSGAAFTEIKRGGDIARGGFDKISLGLQQAAFAIDDFFSATGDISQKIRAVQNNITQLAFVVGGTKGLFIGLGVAIAAQATLALAKWINSGVDASAQTDILNEALERQKQIVEALKAAFDSLRDSLSDGIFSDAQQSSQDFRQELKRLEEAQNERRTERASRFDSDVQEAVAQRNVLENRLEKATDGGQRVAIQRELAELEKREKSLREAAVSRPVPTVDEVVETARDATRARTTSDVILPDTTPDEVEARLRAATTTQEQADILDDLIRERQRIASQEIGITALLMGTRGPGSVGDILDARRDVANLEDQRAALEIPLIAERDALIVSALEFSQGVSSSLLEAKDIVENSLESFDAVAVERNRLAKQFADITDQLSDPDADLSQDQVTQLQQQQEALKEQIDANLSAARSAEAFAETLNRVASDLADTLLSEATSESEQARRDLNEAIGRRQALPADATDEQKRKADEDVANARKNKEEADEDRRRTRDERQSIREDRRKLQEDFNKDAKQRKLSPEANQAVADRERAQRRLDKAKAERDALDENATQAEKDAADRRVAKAQRQKQQTDERTAGVLEDEFESRPGVQRLEQRSDDLDIENARRKALREQRREDGELAASIERGRQFTLSDRQKREEELNKQANDIENALLADRASGAGDAELLQGLNNARGSFFQGTMMAGFQQERRNALLQGPSRAALQVTDITTTQGQSELNRLIRGDDASLDVNLVELQKQSDELARINERLDQVGNSLGIL
jgi:hypothetical protein